MRRMHGTASPVLISQNAAYEVFEGAKKKNEDWDPEDNGGFAVHGVSLTLGGDQTAQKFC